MSIIENITFDFSHLNDKIDNYRIEEDDGNFEISEQFIRLHKFYSELSEKYGDHNLENGELCQLYEDVRDQVYLREFFDEDVINSHDFRKFDRDIIYEFGPYGGYLGWSLEIKQKVINNFFKVLKEKSYFYYENRYLILKFLQKYQIFLSKVSSGEIGIHDDHRSNEQWFFNMMAFFRKSEGIKYVERALNTIEMQKKHLNLIVIVVKTSSDVDYLDHFIVRNRNNYIERTELVLRALLHCKRDEEEGNFDYLLPHWWNFYCFLPRLNHDEYSLLAFNNE